MRRPSERKRCTVFIFIIVKTSFACEVAFLSLILTAKSSYFTVHFFASTAVLLVPSRTQRKSIQEQNDHGITTSTSSVRDQPLRIHQAHHSLTITPMVSSPAFTGGSLSFKGDKKKKNKKAKKKKQASKHSISISEQEDTSVAAANQEDDEMTAAERKAFIRKQQREMEEMESVAKKSHRERVEDFNEKLGQLTEHNDIPRVSAAGNG